MSYQFLGLFLHLIVTCNCLVYYDIDVKGDSENGYYITTLVGTPSQSINLLLDTGSSNLAITVVLQRIPNSQYFMYNNSRTFHSIDTEVHLRYVGGVWSGFLGTDVLNPCLSEDCAVTCNISCMTTMENIFDENSKFQGILGLAYSSITQPNSLVRPFFDIFAEMKSTSNIFSLLFCGPFFSSKEQSTTCGKFHVGFYDEYIEHGVMYTPIIHEWYYEVTVIDLKVGHNSSPMKCHEMNKDKSIIDSGTSNLNVPQLLYDFIISEIHDHLKITIPNKFWLNETVVCMQNFLINATLFPTITLTLYHSKNSSFNLHINPELYLLPLPNSNDNCAKLGIGISNFGVVIGSSILKGFYVIFDRENKRIGFSTPNLFHNVGTINAISNLLVYNIDFDHCIRNDPVPNDTTISPIVIFLLIGICVIVVIFLYALLSWIWKFHIVGRDNLSDTSSLIEDDDD